MNEPTNQSINLKPVIVKHASSQAGLPAETSTKFSGKSRQTGMKIWQKRDLRQQLNVSVQLADAGNSQKDALEGIGANADAAQAISTVFTTHLPFITIYKQDFNSLTCTHKLFQTINRYSHTQSVHSKAVLTKHATKKMITGSVTTPSRYRQPIVGIMYIDTNTTKHVPIAQNNCSTHTSYLPTAMS